GGVAGRRQGRRGGPALQGAGRGTAAEPGPAPDRPARPVLGGQVAAAGRLHGVPAGLRPEGEGGHRAGHGPRQPGARPHLAAADARLHLHRRVRRLSAHRHPLPHQERRAGHPGRPRPAVQQGQVNAAVPSPGVRVVALACYLVALAGAAVLGVLVLALGLGLPRPYLELPCPWAVNLGWLTLFAVQHSGMARAAFKRRWMLLLPAGLERSVYAAASGLLLLGLAATWQPLMGPPLWQGPAWLVVLALAAGLGMALVNLRFDPLGLFGLRQAWADGAGPPERLLVRGPYRFLRHPLMACTLAFLWAQPAMPPTLMLLSGGLSVYILLGVVLEERDLLRRFGPAYADYRRRVPALLPWRRPAPPAEYPALFP